ncbi:MAG: hypothetical protein H7A21_13690 [Spirochaetales bacterium]|nr:hypothetical protein [Leptospiraceae bacterium]MCP5482483.1 hypothetical protein [Spirochaetales bacterium]MCP5485813.1 hypothetical protein [Spirochaetales bacterium]
MKEPQKESGPGTQFDRVCWLCFGLGLLFALQGLSWVLLGAFDPFGFYETLLARSLFGVESLSPEARRVFAFALIPFGATDCAYFLLFTWVVHEPVRRMDFRASRALLVSLLVWFAIDSGACLLHEVYFNILIVNLPCLVLLLPALSYLHLRARTHRAGQVTE